MQPTGVYICSAPSLVTTSFFVRIASGGPAHSSIQGLAEFTGPHLANQVLPLDLTNRHYDHDNDDDSND